MAQPNGNAFQLHGDSRIERLAVRHRADVNFEQKSNESIDYNLMNILKSDNYICELFSRPVQNSKLYVTDEDEIAEFTYL